MSMLQRKRFWLLTVPLVLLLTVAAAYASAPAALTSGLVAQYSFEGNADDSSGNGNDGTQIGAISYAPGQCGQAAVFDGPGSGEYIQVPAHSLQDWTVTAWFQETRDTGTWQRVWDFGSSQGGGGAFFLTTNHGRQSSEIGVGVTQPGVGLVLDLGTGIVPPVGTWHHVAVTYDKGGAGMSIYVDGALSSSASYNAQSFDDFSNQTWWIAKSNWAADPLFQGLIDELYIYNRVLDPAEIQDLATPTCTLNDPPTANAGGPYLVAVGQTIGLDGSGDDPEGDTLSYDWSTDEAGGSFDDPSLEDPQYTAGSTAGVSELTLTVTDVPGGLSDSDTAMVVVYDPEGGFVTGGGWIDSPAGAYKVDESLTGKATFGFVSKYKKGATTPAGNTEFQFKAGDLNFHSSSYEWLVVNQGGSNAQFKGAGTINGQGSYKFMLWAGDGDPDTFRIRIWEEDDGGTETDVYDNDTGQPTDQPIGGGNIVVHTQ